MTTLRCPNGNCVAGLQPAPGDLFVVVLVAGRLALVRAADEYEQVLRLAQAVADGATVTGGAPFTVKVHGASLAELLLLRGISRVEFVAEMKQDEAEFRTIAEQTCREVLRDSQDAAARRDAFDLLVGMGVLAA